MAATPVELIKERLDVVTLLKQYITLNPAGRSFKALCPFHNEKTPSFIVSPERQSWHCFGCNIGGDIFAFVMRYENLEFSEALRVLAEKAGVELRGSASSDYKVTGVLYDASAAARDYFRSELAKAKVAQEYLAGRKLAAETIEEFELGWAPNQSDGLTMYLTQKGFAQDDIVRAGLVFKNERGLVSDRFRGRIMFPIHNSFGKVVGFTGRILPQLDTGDLAKYSNTPETPIFNKSKLLYGFWKSKNAMRDAKAAFLVEGQMDFLMSYQAGIRHAVASSGTALTIEHLKTLRRFTDTLLLSFDSDAAGMQAGERAIDLAEANDFNVSVVFLEGFKDPADVAAANPELLRTALTNARPATEFYFHKYLPKESSPGPLTRDALNQLRVVLGKILNISSSVSRSFWLKELARRTGVAESVLAEEAQGITSSQSPRDSAEQTKQQERGFQQALSRRELLSQCVIAAAHAANNFALAEPLVPFFPPDYQEVFERLKRGEKSAADGRLDSVFHLVLLRASYDPETDIEMLATHLKEEYKREMRLMLTADVRRAEERDDSAALDAALAALRDLESKQL